MNGALVSIRDLRVAFGGVPVLHGVSLDVAPGEAVALVGESGCGKSITWLAALGLLPRTALVSGSVTMGGAELLGADDRTLSAVRGRRVALISQDPGSALNPVHRVGRQIVESLALHRGLRGASARAEAVRLLTAVGLPDPRRRMDSYPHELSGGQNQRVCIAIALAGQPDLLVADEPTTALDVTIQAQILDLLRQLRQDTGMALVLISHDLAVVADTCERVCVMYAGRVLEDAPAAALFERPAHPYAAGLLGAMPAMDGPRRRLLAIPGAVPSPDALPPGCAFAPRCPLAIGACEAGTPALRALDEGRRVACIRAETAAAREPVFA